jgi:large subunit ribosomal protein L25
VEGGFLEMGEKEIVVRAKKRERFGKNEARRLRRAGFIPVIVYGGDAEPVAAAAPRSELAAILRSETGHNTIFKIEIEGVGTSEVLFQDWDFDPVYGRLIHADLRRLLQDQTIDVTVPVHLVGNPVGVREQGGILEQVVREIEIRCRPRDIPEAIEVDVSHLGIHDVLHVADIPKDERFQILEPPDTVIATVGVVREEELAAAPVEEEAEPEVISKGKKEEEKGES